MNDHKELIRRWLKMAESGFAGDFSEYFCGRDYIGHLSSQDPQTLDDLIRLERGYLIANTKPRLTWQQGIKCCPGPLATARRLFALSAPTRCLNERARRRRVRADPHLKSGKRLRDPE